MTSRFYKRKDKEFKYADTSQQSFEAVLKDKEEGARSRAFSMIAEGTTTETGCIEKPTLGPREVLFAGRQMQAYRFIHCVLNWVVARYDDVVRHRCNISLCINPDHLEMGSRGDNLQDDHELAANGENFNLH